MGEQAGKVCDLPLHLTTALVVEQIIRPTGLLDPILTLRPLKEQIDETIELCRQRVEKGERVLVTTLTKRTAEDLAEYLSGTGLKCRYLHSDIDAIERVEILRQLRAATFDILIGITPQSVIRSVQQSLHSYEKGRQHADNLNASIVAEDVGAYDKLKVIAELEQEMRDASSKLEFERAAHLRDQIATLKNATPVMPPQKKVKYGKKKGKGKS